MKIYHYYHIWADGKWELPVSEHLAVLNESALMGNLKEFNIGIVGKEENRIKVKEYLEKNVLKYSIVAEANEGFEQETMDKMVECSSKNGVILYAHTKGSSNDTEFEHIWRRSMNHDLIKDWVSCLELLGLYAAVGTHYAIPTDSGMICNNRNVKTERGFFYGNFFWTHVRYAKALGYPNRSLTSYEIYSRIDAEYWLLGLKEKVENIFKRKFKVYDKNPYFDEKHFIDHRVEGEV